MPAPVQPEQKPIPQEQKNNSAPQSIWSDQHYIPSFHSTDIIDGDAKLFRKDYVGAVVSYGNAISSQPQNDSLYVKRGIAYILYNDTFHAQPDLEKAVALSPKSQIAHAALGNLYGRLYSNSQEGSEKQTGFYNKGVSEFGTAVEFDRRNKTPLLGRAFLYQKAGFYSLAEQDYSSLSSSNYPFPPLRAVAMMEYARHKSLTVSENTRYFATLSAATEHINISSLVPPSPQPQLSGDVPQKDIGGMGKIAPDAARRFAAIGDAYLFYGNYSYALYYYKQAKLADPMQSESYAKRGLIFLKTKQKTLARDELTQGQKLDPFGAFSNFALGVYYLGESDQRNALAAFEQSISKNPNEPEYYLYRALAQDMAGNTYSRDRDMDKYYGMLVAEGYPAGE